MDDDAARKKRMDRRDRHTLARWEEAGTGPDLTPSKYPLSPQELKTKKRMEKNLENFTKGDS